MPYRAVALLFVTLLVSSCASSPLSPSPVSLPFRAGTYIVTFLGADTTQTAAGSIVAGCPGINQAGFGTVTTAVAMSFDGTAWHARPSVTAGGSFDIRLVPLAVQTADPTDGVALSGTASGLVKNTLVVVIPNGDTGVTLGGGPLGSNVVLGGVVTPDGYVASGLVIGDVVFTNGQGAAISCNSGTVAWSLSRLGLP